MGVHEGLYQWGFSWEGEVCRGCVLAFSVWADRVVWLDGGSDGVGEVGGVRGCEDVGGRGVVGGL